MIQDIFMLDGGPQAKLCQKYRTQTHSIVSYPQNTQVTPIKNVKICQHMPINATHSMHSKHYLIIIKSDPVYPDTNDNFQMLCYAYPAVPPRDGIGVPCEGVTSSGTSCVIHRHAHWPCELTFIPDSPSTAIAVNGHNDMI